MKHEQGWGRTLGLFLALSLLAALVFVLGGGVRRADAAASAILGQTECVESAANRGSVAVTLTNATGGAAGHTFELRSLAGGDVFRNFLHLDAGSVGVFRIEAIPNGAFVASVSLEGQAVTEPKLLVISCPEHAPPASASVSVQPTEALPPAPIDGLPPVPSDAEPSRLADGWVSPAQTGHRASNLLQFAAANDGPAGVTIDQAFLNANSGAPWLSYEGNRPVISRMDASGRCLNILVTITLRDSLINCPTRVQNDSWGYVGQVDDAPAVNVLAQNVIVEHNTITCSGHDGNICSRSVRAGSSNTTVQYNDLSFARGAVATYHGTVFRFNYVHDLSFGFDPTRAANADNVTHNNAVNNLGYSNVLIEGNHIIALYGRVSSQPGTYRAPSFHGVYSGGVVEVGDPINGFVFANYLVNGNGSNFRVIDNYVVGAGRPFQCNGSGRHVGANCGANVSGNAFAADRFADFAPVALFYDSEGAGSISGSCNVRSLSGSFQVLPSDVFGSAGTHGTNGC